MNEPIAELTTRIILDALDHRDPGVVGGNQIRLQKRFELCELAPYYVNAFKHIRNWAGRNEILFWLQKLARQRSDVVEIAIFALNDRSYMVRYQACAILAYSLCKDATDDLVSLLNHKDLRSRADAAAAIRAIEQQNHHLFADREETGRIYWEV